MEYPDKIVTCMFVPVLRGGLGNNLFQVATTIALAKKYSALPVLCEQAVLKDIHSNRSYIETIFQKIPVLPKLTSVRKLKEPRAHDPSVRHSIEHAVSTFRDPVLVLDGCFQDYRYFHDYYDELCDIFETSGDLPVPTQSYYFHIRFGDFETHALHIIDQIPFYKAALSDLLRHNPQITFVVSAYNPNNLFKKVLQFIDTVCDGIVPKNDYIVCTSKDAQSSTHRVKFLMDVSVTQNELSMLHILRNCALGGIGPHSTFSWWAGYLNRNPNKRIYIPNVWTNEAGANFEGMFFPSTIRLSY
jgi:hypothetical protein